MHSEGILPESGILPGCSLSVSLCEYSWRRVCTLKAFCPREEYCLVAACQSSLAKLYLWDTLEALQKSPGLVDSATWIDRLSFDLIGLGPNKLAR